MIATHTHVRVQGAQGLTDDAVTAVMDHMAALEAVRDDLLDWPIGSTLSEGLLEVDLTLESASPQAAVSRADELVRTAVVAGLEDGWRTESVSAEFVAA
ncbi:MAG: hypothetical protein U0990_02715 [Candidatus Nanopelagicales bacterium]|nr:hypothetical protein [Candidatus Nanopelagicales bacterium]MDZ4248984.1 hypothetical protein [Candidatus Nanopelagicales bacterium]